MKKLYLLLPILFLIYWGCEEKTEEETTEEDTTPPTVSISSHSSGQTVYEIITITVTTQDNEGISKVEFFIDNSLVKTDTESPYEYEWNTTQYQDDSEHIVKVISYDNSENFTESQPILLIVDNRVYLWGEYYVIDNTTELKLGSGQLTGPIPPEIGRMINLEKLYLYLNQLTGEIPSEIGNLTNLTELRLEHNQLTDSIPPEIGQLTNLTTLELEYNQLTGPIPPEIGNLTNLTELRLEDNQLTGRIPESICNLNLEWNTSNFNIDNNQLCPPYPSCIEDYVGGQDTSDCP